MRGKLYLRNQRFFVSAVAMDLKRKEVLVARLGRDTSRSEMSGTRIKRSAGIVASRRWIVTAALLKISAQPNARAVVGREFMPEPKRTYGRVLAQISRTQVIIPRGICLVQRSERESLRL